MNQDMGTIQGTSWSFPLPDRCVLASSPPWIQQTEDGSIKKWKRKLHRAFNAIGTDVATRGKGSAGVVGLNSMAKALLVDYYNKTQSFTPSLWI